MSGCASFSTFQTADTIPKGAYQVGLGFTAGTIRQKGEVASNDAGYLTYPLPGLNFRYGLLNLLDIGIESGIGFGYFWGMDIKTMILKQKKNSIIPDISIGIGRKGELLIEGEDGDRDAAGTHNFISLYFSKTFKKNITYYGSYRKMYSNLSIMEPSSGRTVTENIKIKMDGITLGLGFEQNNKAKYMLEYGYYWSGTNQGNSIQNIGFSYFFKPKKLFGSNKDIN